MNEDVPASGLSNLCRLCGEDDGECVDLFDQNGQGDELLAKIELAIRIDISENDGLPTRICLSCEEKLVAYTSFYQQCHDTQDRLQEFLSIESVMHKTCVSDGNESNVNAEESEMYEYDSEGETEEVFYYEELPEEDQGEGDAVEMMEIGEDTQGEEEEEEQGEDQRDLILPEAEDSNIDDSGSMRLISSPITVVGDLNEINESSNLQSLVLEATDQFSLLESHEKPTTQLVYLVKNAAHIPVESVLSAVLCNPETEPTQKEQRTAQARRRKKRRRRLENLKYKNNKPENQHTKKVVIKGSDGRENMIVLDLPPSEIVPAEIPNPIESEIVDDPNWVPGALSRPSSRNSSFSTIRRARSALKNSMRILRLPKPLKKREPPPPDPSRKPARKRKPITKDDPNYAVMMEKFAKPVSVSTLKRHGLYQPRNSGYKINAPYKKDVAPYIEKVSDTEFKCKICHTASFRWNYKAEIHILEHLDWRPFECDMCGRSFTQNQYLTKHKRLHFPDDTNFMCEICGKGFQRRYYLTYHMDEHFERIYTCEVCGRKFTRRQKHDEHVRYHHKCHYSVCDICGQTLRTTALSRHRKQHGEKSLLRRKRETGGPSQTWLTCVVCCRAFRSLRERDDHEAEHGNPLLPFSCDDCGVYFRNKRSLNNHLLNTHSNMTEEECEVTTQEEESALATRVLDELSATIVVSIPEDI